MSTVHGLKSDVVRAEIGEHQWKYVTRLVQNRLETPVEDIRFRMAPSIMARSECELFSASAPRFAIRLSLPNGGFLNLRRIPLLAEICRSLRWVSAPAGCPTPSDVIGKNAYLGGCCIADSVLVAPKSLLPPNQWHVLSAPLGGAYGEFGARETSEIVGTPFVRQILLGGGMCAQACCYMATALLHEHAAGIHGVVEVTALSSKGIMNGEEGELSLGGMDVKHMSNYFRNPHVNLRAPVLDLPLALTGKAKLDSDGLFAYYLQAVRSYLLSGFPAILAVDPSELYRSEDGSNQEQQDGGSKATVLHAVLAVGAKLHDASGVVYNDPSRYPFEIAERANLFSAVSIPGLRSFRKFLPVTPNDVRLPLLTPTSRPSEPFFGLDALLRFVFPIVTPDKKSEAEYVEYGDPNPKDEFRLFTVEAPRDVWSDTLRRGDSIDPEFFALLDQWLSGPDGKPLSWVWSRHRRHADHEPVSESIVLCDATRELPAKSMAESARQTRGKNLALCLFVKDKPDGKWRIEWSSRGNVLPSMITSHTCGTAKHVHRSLTQVDKDSLIKGLEWYSFMQTETDIIRRRRLADEYGIDYVSALEFMAGFSNQGGQALDAAVDDLLGEMLRGTRPIVALATFVPTLSLPPNSVGAVKGRHALAFVSAVARRLADRQVPQRRIVIEIVGGSRVQGLSAESDTSYKASFFSEESCTSNLLHNLRLLVHSVGSEQVIWAIELEPGPLFTIRDWASISTFCEQIEKDEVLAGHAGINMDISHWRICATNGVGGSLDRICPRQIRDSPSVFGRIVHAHISGHHDRAHFGDIPIGVLNTPDEFAPWLDLLRERAACTQTSLPFSGYVSFEFEAAKDELICSSALQDFAMLLGRTNGGLF